MIQQKTLKCETKKIMKALIKYLPDPNDEGIICPDPDSIEVTEGKDPRSMEVSFKANKLRKLKFFVVTQDIEVGDEFYNNYNTGFKYKAEKVSHAGWIICSDTMEHDFPPENCYKILGEPSPKATFVEDGKEYELLSGVSTDGQKYLIMKSGFILIKCPCCGDFK